MWANYHTHSNYCDGKGALAEIVAAARAQGLLSLGFSSHAPLPFERKWAMRKESLPEYLEEIEHLKRSERDIAIFAGLEIDFIPTVISPFQYKDVLDYTIGSIHFVDALPGGEPWEIDNTFAVFENGLQSIFKGNVKDALTRYFELTREMIFASAPDIIGHLDKIKIQNQQGKLFSEDEAWYKDEVEKTLKLIEQADSIVEVNTRGIYQKKTTTTYPSPWILEKMLERNIRITMSSDAHVAQDLTACFDSTAALLTRIGFKTITVLDNGRWEQVPLSPTGIV